MLEDAESDLRSWERTVEPIPSAPGAGETPLSRKAPRESLATAAEEQSTPDITTSEDPNAETESTLEGEKSESNASGAIGTQPVVA